MISSGYYHLVYLVFVTLLSIVTLFYYGSYSSKRLQDANKHKFDGAVLIVVFLTLYIGGRNPFAAAFQDTQAYTLWYNKKLGQAFTWDWTKSNFLYDNLMFWMSSVRVPVSFFYVFIALLYFGGIWLCCKKLFPNDTIASFVVYLAAFSTYSYSVNGIKAGAAAAFFLVAIAMRKEKRKLWVAVFLFLSLGFHHSMLMPIAAFLICWICKNPKPYMVFWVVCFVMAALHVSFFQDLFVSIGEDVDDKIVGYFRQGTKGYIKRDFFGGFRIDFILYSFIPILVGWIAVFKKNIKSSSYLFLLNLYTFINAIWMLCMYASFTNRIAYLSWSLYPIVLIYPLLKEKWGSEQYKIFKWVAYGHLGFTLFMNFIYT